MRHSTMTHRSRARIYTHMQSLRYIRDVKLILHENAFLSSFCASSYNWNKFGSTKKGQLLDKKY
jgi:hypothetical protein